MQSIKQRRKYFSFASFSYLSLYFSEINIDYLFKRKNSRSALEVQFNFHARHFHVRFLEQMKFAALESTPSALEEQLRLTGPDSKPLGGDKAEVRGTSAMCPQAQV